MTDTSDKALRSSKEHPGYRNGLALRLQEWSRNCLIDGLVMDKGEPTLQSLLREAVSILMAPAPETGVQQSWDVTANTLSDTRAEDVRDIPTQLTDTSDTRSLHECDEAHQTWLNMPNEDRGTLNAFRAGYDRGFAVGSGDEGAYQREIARLQAIAQRYSEHLCMIKGCTLPRSHVGDCNAFDSEMRTQSISVTEHGN